MKESTQQEKSAPGEAPARKSPLTLPWLMLLLPIPIFFVLNLVIGISSLSDSYPPISFSEKTTVALHSHDTISLSTMGDTTCAITGPNGYKGQVHHKSATKFGSDTFVTGARGKYHITCGDGSYVTVDSVTGNLASEEASRQANEKNQFVMYAALLTMAAGLVILIQRMRQRKKISRADTQAQAAD